MGRSISASRTRRPGNGCRTSSSAVATPNTVLQTTAETATVTVSWIAWIALGLVSASQTAPAAARRPARPPHPPVPSEKHGAPPPADEGRVQEGGGATPPPPSAAVADPGRRGPRERREEPQPRHDGRERERHVDHRVDHAL